MSTFVSRVVSVLSGSVLAQAIAFGLTPLLSRLYTPEMFGVLGYFGAIAGLLALSSSLKFELAIVLPKEERDALSVVHLALALTTAVGLLVFMGVLTVRLLGQLPHESLNVLENLYGWLVPGVVGIGYFQILGYWAARREDFKAIGVAAVVRTLGASGVQVLMGFLKVGALGLVLGQVIGVVLATCFLVSRTMRSAASWKLDIGGMVRLFKEHRKFPIYSAPTSFVNSLSQHLPTLLLAYFFGPVVVGFYWFAQKVMETPMSTLGGAVRQVYFQDIAKVKAEGQAVYPRWRRVTLSLAGLSLVPLVVLLVGGPWMFGFVFGDEWIVAGEYSRWLVLWVCAGFINSPSVMAIHVFKLQEYQMVYEVALLVARAIALVSGGLLGDPVISIAGFAIVGATFNAALVGMVGWKIRTVEA